MRQSAHDALDFDQVAYFRARYGALDDHELAELARRRDSLADEAVEALNAVISARGISVADLAAAATPAPEAPLEQQVSLATELWAGAASRTGQFLSMVAFGSIGGLLARQVPALGSSPGPAGGSALVAGLIVLALGYGGYRFGRYCTREICANGDKPIAQRRGELRWFAAGVAAAYFVIFAVLSSVLPRG